MDENHSLVGVSSWRFELEFREWKDNVGRAARPFAAARGIGLSSRFSPQSFLLSLLGDLEVRRSGGILVGVVSWSLGEGER